MTVILSRKTAREDSTGSALASYNIDFEGGGDDLLEGDSEAGVMTTPAVACPFQSPLDMLPTSGPALRSRCQALTKKPRGDNANAGRPSATLH